MSRYWFKPKRYGYGPTPVTWEGWALVGAFVAVVIGATTVEMGSGTPGITQMVIASAIIVLAVVVTTVVSRFKTDGAWRWRWGPEA